MERELFIFLMVKLSTKDSGLKMNLTVGEFTTLILTLLCGEVTKDN
jgi:hypothetical protein